MNTQISRRKRVDEHLPLGENTERAVVSGQQAAAKSRTTLRTASTAAKRARETQKPAVDAATTARAQMKESREARAKAEAAAQAKARAKVAAEEEAAKAQEVRKEAEEARAQAEAEEEEAAKAQEVRKEAEEARAQAEAEEEEAAKAQEVRKEAKKARAQEEEQKANARKEEEATKTGEAAAEQRQRQKAAKVRHLYKFLVAANFEEYFDKLTNYGIESVEDLCLATADDLAEAGVTKPFHRRKLLAAAAKWSKNSGQTESDTIILSKITEHMRTGDKHLAEDECAVARDAYATALSMAQELKLTDLVTVLDWKVYKADFCLGAAVLPLSGPGTEDATCGISTLANELLLSDFNIAASRFGFRRVQHWDEWFKLFGLTQQSCSPKALKRSYYRRMVKYHPDKFNGPQHCATMMALILNAGKELLDSHSACANEREL